MRTRIITALVVCSTAMLGWQSIPHLAEPYATPPVSNPPKVIPKPEGASLHLPPGFKAELYASVFERPRYMALGPHDEILVSDFVPNGSVLVLHGSDRKTLLSGLDRPYGLAFWKDYLYVAEATSLKRYKYDPKSLSAGPGEEVVSMKGFDKGHVTRDVIFDRKGEKMYVAAGSSANIVTGDPELLAAISRFNPDGTGKELIATGVRNPVGIRFYPGTDKLWASVQERDGMGDELVPDYFTEIRTGAFYGWPYAYIGPHQQPKLELQRPDLVDRTIVPDLLLESHTAVMDFLFYSGKQFPAEYRGGALLANHGSSNRSKRVGYSLTFVPFRDGKPSGPARDFLTGFMLSPDQKEVWGRPVGLLQLKDGSLLVSEDGNKTIWRISYEP